MIKASDIHGLQKPPTTPSVMRAIQDNIRNLSNSNLETFRTIFARREVATRSVYSSELKSLCTTLGFEYENGNGSAYKISAVMHEGKKPTVLANDHVPHGNDSLNNKFLHALATRLVAYDIVTQDIAIQLGLDNFAVIQKEIDQARSNGNGNGHGNGNGKSNASSASSNGFPHRTSDLKLSVLNATRVHDLS